MSKESFFFALGEKVQSAFEHTRRLESFVERQVDALRRSLDELRNELANDRRRDQEDYRALWRDQGEKSAGRLAEVESKVRNHVAIEGSVTQLRQALADEATARRKLEAELHKLEGRVGELSSDEGD